MQTIIEGIPIANERAPATLAELCDAVRDLAEQREAIYPAGGRTALDLGLPPARPGTLLDTTRLTRIDDYPSEDMTITVETGIRVGELARVLSAKGQMLPIDVPSIEQATLGGIIATNTSGPRRYGYGTLRDYVIGIDVVGAEGKRIHGGGRVVKNVAGYDFMKLHTGALGTLGVVAQVTLKLRPIPEARSALWTVFPLGHAERILERLNRSATRPVAIELVNRAAANGLPTLELSADRPWGLIVLFEESAPAVAWQEEQLRRELAELGVTDVNRVPTESYDELLQSLTGWPERPGERVLFKANLLRGGVVAFCARAEHDVGTVRLLAHAGSGVVWGTIPADEGAMIESLIRSLADLADVHQGNLTLPRLPTEWKASLPVWGRPRGDRHLMARLKEKLDPNHIFNPGRFVG